jgi:hypothetical protein
LLLQACLRISAREIRFSGRQNGGGISGAAGSLTGFKFGSRHSKPPEVVVDFQL